MRFRLFQFIIACNIGQALLPFLEADAVDVCIVDPLWNGVDESCKMAALCDVFEVELT